MSLEAELQCPECKRLIKDVDSLDTRECPWCGAFLVNVNPENSNSTSSKRTVKPGLFDEIDVSDDDEFTTTTTTTQPKLSSLQQDDDDDDGHEFSLENILSQFKQEMKHRPMSSARPKRRKVELFDELDDSDDDNDNWNVSITSKKNKKKKKKGKETRVFQASDEDLDAVEEGRLNTNKKRYNLSFPSDSGSEYTLSDSEGSLLESSEDEQERKTKPKDDPQDYKPDPVKKAAKAKETSTSNPAATTKETKAKALPSSSSSSSTTPSASRPLGSFLIFNKEMRGKLAKENKDLSQKDLSRLVSGMWNKMSKEQKAKYANMKPTAKKLVPPPGNGYVLFKKEQFPLVQKEYNLKGEHIMRTVSTLIGVRWKNLDPDLRESYTQRAKQARQEWALEHPHEYEVFMNNMKAKVSQAKKGKKRTKA
ncbi:unnamed protein product [Mucor circinelloides]